MRITSGKNKGKVLASPEGLATRPTADRARQAIFNIIMHAGWLPHDVLDGAHVMDVFAGTGAMGLEALSRGGADGVFVENDRAALAALRSNVIKMNAGPTSTILTHDALHMPPRPSTVAPRTLVFFDPPYGKNLGAQALDVLVKRNWLDQHCLCVMEMSKKEPETSPAGFTQRDERTYGVALVRFLTRD